MTSKWLLDLVKSIWYTLGHIWGAIGVVFGCYWEFLWRTWTWTHCSQSMSMFMSAVHVHVRSPCLCPQSKFMSAVYIHQKWPKMTSKWLLDIVKSFWYTLGHIWEAIGVVFGCYWEFLWRTWTLKARFWGFCESQWNFSLAQLRVAESEHKLY